MELPNPEIQILSIGFLYSPAYTKMIDGASPMENIDILFGW